MILAYLSGAKYMDIIYDDPKYYPALSHYSKLIFWNGTIIE